MSELTPITRIESYLDAIVNSGTPPLEDITRIETFLQAIYDNQVCALTPITRIEMFLGKISGQDIVLPEPITRIELYLAAIAGEDVELPEEPITRIEMYLADWADSGDWTTISGAIVEFITQRAHKLKSCIVSLEPQQDLSHGDPSPTNICPISGWTGVTVKHTGKSIIPFIVETMTPEINFNGFAGWNSGWKVPGRTGVFTYSVYIDNTNAVDKSGVSVWFRGSDNSTYVDGTSQSGTYIQAGSKGVSTITIDMSNRPNTYYLYFGLSLKANGTANNPIVVVGSTPADYEPYKGNSYSVTFGETVYGGYDEIVSGNGKANFGRYKFTGNEPTAQVSANKVAIKTANDWKSSQLGWCTDFKFDSTGATNWIYLNTTMSAEGVKTYMGSHDVYAVCELATPTDITTTPTPITALKGYNAMWSDAGDIEVTVHGTPVEVETLQALNLLLGGAYHNDQTAEDVSDDEALDILLGGADR